MEVLEFFRSKGTLKKTVLPCPSSRKYVPQDMSLLEQDLNASMRTVTTEAGTDYVAEYVKKEEEELFKAASFFSTVDRNNMDSISMGTAVSIQDDAQNEELNKIYRTYNFAYRPKLNLTITSKKDEIVSMIETNSVVVIQGPTGCGKTTQVPQFILDSCYKRRLHCNIIVTQPRRIAAMSIAKRVSQERDWPVGTLVGFQVGLINNTTKDTRLTYCTTGVLLHKLINAKNMLDYTHVILDEVHERDQDMDFLLLVVRKLLCTNSRNVKIILMSATFQVDKFARYFSLPVGNKLVPAPIIDVAKKNYFNVSVYYLCQLPSLGPLPDINPNDQPHISKRMMDLCVNLVMVIDDLDMQADDVKPEGDSYDRHVILIFLPGIHEIEEMHSILSLPKYEKSKWDVVVLHSSISNEEQHRIFEKPPKGYRRIILSTNIAESSITVPDVKYVIDFCLTKQLVTDPKTNFQCLELIWASKTNCEQRAGRTGRVMDGRVYRLVPQYFYESILTQDGAPEMLRAPLENLVLKAKMLDMGEPKAIFALSLDPPDLGNLGRTILILKEAGALLNKTEEEINPFDGELTDLGRIMANLPLDIHVTKLIMLGHVFSIFKDSIIIAASMSVKEMFSNPFRDKLLAYSVKMSWANNSCSDCISFLNVYKVWITKKASRHINSDQTEKNWALRNFIQIRVLREVKALVSELTLRLDRLGIRESAGLNKVNWGEKDRPFVLKFVIAGAFYPNYFVRRLPGGQVDDHAGVKLLGGLDPSTTVYLQGWPMRQPGLLYARRFQDAFKDCLTTPMGKIKVSFDASSRVYIQFNKNENTPHQKDMTKRISPLLYKAIRMRQCNMSIDIPLLDEDEAYRRAEEKNLIRKTFFVTSLNDNVYGNTPRLPGLNISRIPIIIQHVDEIDHFWVQIRDSETKRRLDVIRESLDVQESLHMFNHPPEVGTMVIAPYERNNSVVYERATVESYKPTSPEIMATIFFVDHGYTTDIRLCDLRRTNDEEVLRIPPLALECVLANLGPSVAHNFSDEWSRKASSVFTSLIRKSGKYFGEIYSVVNSVIALEIIYRGDEGEININQYLIDEGFAIRREEDYFSRYNHELRMKQADLTDEQRKHFERMQYDQTSFSETYPDPPQPHECGSHVTLRGPFSPLEIELGHLTIAGRDKRVNVATNSVNCVLLDTDPEDTHERLLVAGSVSQNIHGNNLTLYNTTLLPNLHGLMALIVLIFTPNMELRRNSFGNCYIGALCGLGCDPVTKRSIFPEHDIELLFDVEITMTDLEFVNRLRHWMNIGMQIYHGTDGVDNMEQIIICQNRIKDAFLKVTTKHRKSQEPQHIHNFDKWNRYDESLFIPPNRESILTNRIYKLHYALELEESNVMQEMTEHLLNLQMLATENPRKLGNNNIFCKMCDVTLAGPAELRAHLYTKQHRRNEEKLNIKL